MQLNFLSSPLMPTFRFQQIRRDHCGKGVTWAGLALRESGTTPVTRNAAGFYGYYAGPEITIVDLFGLCDPLLARLPATRQSGWRAGHLEREAPAEYLATIATDCGMAGDSDVVRLENRIRLVARGPLFTGERWKAIWELNSGGGFAPRAE